MDLRKPLPASHVAAVLTAVALILWRIWDRPLVALWRDWVVLLSIYGVAVLFMPQGRPRTGVTVGAMAGLIALYAWDQAPRILALLRVLA